MPPPPTFGNAASALLEAAAGALEEGIRAIVAPGPQHAHDCRMVAVYGSILGWQNLSQDLMAQTGFASALQAEFRVVFVADCVPASSTQAPPDAGLVTEWSATMLDDWEKVWRAVGDSADLGLLLTVGDADPEPVVNPLGVDLIRSEPFGPSGGAAGFRGTVRALLTP